MRERAYNFSVPFRVGRDARTVLYGQQLDRLVLTVKYSQSYLCFIAKSIRLKIYW
jgi:hypothetical protein